MKSRSYIYIIFLISIIAVIFNNDGLISVDWLGYHINVNISLAIAALSLISLVKMLVKNSDFIMVERAMMMMLNGITFDKLGLKKDAIKSFYRSLSYSKNSKIISNFINIEKNIVEGNEEVLKKNYLYLLDRTESQIVAIYELMNFAFDRNDLVEVQRLINKSEEMFPRRNYFTIMKIKLYKITRDWEKLVKEIDVADRKGVRLDFDAKSEKALIYYAMSEQKFFDDNMKSSEDFIKKSLYLKPDFVGAIIMQAKIILKNGDVKKAKNLLEKNYKLLKHKNLADEYIKISTEGGITGLQAANILHNSIPRDSYACFLIAKNALKEKDYPMALDYARKAEKEGKMTKSLCNMIINLLHKLGENEKLVYEYVNMLPDIEEDPSWICAKCCCQTNKWKLFCKECSELGSVFWSESL